MVEAYLLIQNEMGAGARITKEVSGIQGVTFVRNVTGPYDIIARAEAKDLDSLSRLVDKVQVVPGVTRTMTCPILKV
jgi:DNA-binding Lrp family transcriptional regulator